MLHFKTFCSCNESARCFAQIGSGDKTECKILLTNYPDGKCPFYKVKAYDKPRRIEKEAKQSD